jgi:uncharacterized DUF497 family protein
LEFEWDDVKARESLAKHGISFSAATANFDGLVVEHPDRRQDYGEEGIRA